MIHPSKIFYAYINVANTLLQKTDLISSLQDAFLSERLFP